MMFDKGLCFAHELDLQAFTNGQVGDVLDLGANNQLGGRQVFVAIAFNDDTTATGDPEFTFELEFSESKNFADSIKISVPMQPLKKGDMQKGKVACAPAPMYSKRYVKLLAKGTGDIACSNIDAGFVLDPQTNGLM